MNWIAPAFGRSAGWFISALIVSLLVSCATRARVDWASRVGSYTFDDAVIELGPPDKQAQLADGTVVAEWLTQHSYAYAYPGAGYPWYPGVYYTPMYYPETGYSPNYYLRLVFGPDHKLRSWQKFAR